MPLEKLDELTLLQRLALKTHRPWQKELGLTSLASMG